MKLDSKVNPQAFPISDLTNYGVMPTRDAAPESMNGMTLLDYFAAKAMQTVVGDKHYDMQQMFGRNVNSYISHSLEDSPSESDLQHAEERYDADLTLIASYSYKVAAAMLEERKKYI